MSADKVIRTPDGGSVLVYCGNLRTGGAVQVAASFLDELAELCLVSPSTGRWVAESWRIEVSNNVFQNLRPETTGLPLVTVTNRRLFELLKSLWRRSTVDVEFVIFGPLYRRRAGTVQMLGYADVLTLYVEPSVLDRRSIAIRFRAAIRNHLVRTLVRRADLLVVETEDAKDRVCGTLDRDPSRVEVVPNTVNSAFLTTAVSLSNWTAPDLSREIRFAFVARGYPHKNHDFLGALGAELLATHGIRVRFVVTLTRDEFDARSTGFKRYSENHGPVTVSEARELYSTCEAAIFPSLIEVYSASPLEALAMGIPLFASDRAFVRTCVKDAATYFDPENARSAGRTIAEALRSAATLEKRRSEGVSVVNAIPTARDRAERYLEIIGQHLGPASE